jgi:uncharacterized membrane protein
MLDTISVSRRPGKPGFAPIVGAAVAAAAWHGPGMLLALTSSSGSSDAALPVPLSPNSAHEVRVMSHDPSPDRRESASTGIEPPPRVEGVGVSGGAAHPHLSLPERRNRHDGTHRAIRAIKAEHAETRTSIERLADALTRAAGSTPFLLAHVAWFAAWMVWNTGEFGLRAFDPFPFGLLTMIVSLEAIFLSIFVLMSQARESAIAELREELTLQVNLRMEEEVTKTLQLVAGLYTRIGYRVSDDRELAEMLRPLDAAEIERSLVEQIRACYVPLGRRTRRAVTG